MGIPFPGTLAAAANSLLQTMPVPLPSPVPATGSVGGAGAGTGSDGGLDSLPRDRSRERDRPCKCPPDKGSKVQKNHSMNPEPRRYQARITGFEYGITTDGKGRETNQGWNMEWAWQPAGEPKPVTFDGFVKAQCLLQEAKGNYDQLLDKFFDEDGESIYDFDGFSSTKKQIIHQADVVRKNPPSRLMWYFETPRFQKLMSPTLTKAGVPSICTG
ncbi:Restriction endonuclease fold toxin 5 [Paraburkholderia tropica]|uniref:Tox-REase-5 domain-containing protein n=1 Tax=Paraburkholderia tropica TaxID=92647 RepID=UPI001CB6074F|nr:Tox-REase-5 domain-containing protein [Paraburkholderia tropica]CAG9234419.1 Restriction endonuclease fold toxin 5 [Paraburkholderia tropica]